MFSRLGYIVSLCLFGLVACGPDSVSTEKQGASQTAATALPATLSESYKRAFFENPRVTALRFLEAYDDVSESGPVTEQRVKDLARLRAGFERGQLLGHIVAMDLNGNASITKTEADLALSLPGWSNKPITFAGLFEADENQDGRISMDEAVRYSHTLYEHAARPNMRPIGSYLMLADLNADGIVMRDEMKTYLSRFLMRS